MDPLEITQREPEARVIMILGGSDTGKTTLAETLARELASKFATAVVDCDMGQSRIGPPMTIGWARVPREGFQSLDGLAVKGFFFVGTLSPFGNLLPTVAGAKRMCEEALRECEKVIVDTTGLVSEPVGRILKQNKIDLLQPDLVLALESQRELEHILEPYLELAKPKVHRLKTPEQVRTKSPEMRSSYREKKFTDYFKNSSRVRFSLDEMKLRFLKNQVISEENRVGYAVSLRDGQNRDLVLGIVEASKKNEITLRLPPVEASGAKYILFGEKITNNA